MIPHFWPRTTLQTTKRLACNLIQQKYLLYSLSDSKASGMQSYPTKILTVFPTRQQSVWHAILSSKNTYCVPHKNYGKVEISRHEYMKNSAVGFPLVPLQKQIETASHPQRQVVDVKIFKLLQWPSYMRRQY